MQIMIISRHTERSRVWKGVLVVVPPSSYRCLGDGDTGPIGVKLCMVWYILVPDTKYSLLGGAVSRSSRNFFWQFWLISKSFDGEYLKNGKSERYIFRA